jgi:hypothetical protein
MGSGKGRLGYAGTPFHELPAGGSPDADGLFPHPKENRMKAQKKE